MTDAILRTFEHPDFVRLMLLSTLKFCLLWFAVGLGCFYAKHFDN